MKKSKGKKVVKKSKVLSKDKPKDSAKSRVLGDEFEKEFDIGLKEFTSDIPNKDTKVK
jgi:hypothetical protein